MSEGDAAPATHPAPATLGVLALALFLAALTMRPQVVGVGPLLPRIQDDLVVGAGVSGLLVTIPVLCMGVFAPLTPWLSSRLGSRRAIACSLVAIGLFGSARAIAPDIAVLVGLTVLVGAAVAVGQSMLPVAVKEAFSERPAVATGVYATGIMLGAAGSALAATPIADAAGTWRGTLLAFSLGTLLLAGLWWATRQGGKPSRARATLPRMPLRSGVAWLLAAIFCILSVLYYGLNAWLPAFLVEAGWTEVRAGAVLALVNLTGLFGTLGVPRLADRVGPRRAYLTGASGTCAVFLAALLLQPAWGWLWAVPVGASIGALFSLCLTLPLDVSATPAAVGAVAGMMFGVGYGLAAAAPALLGAFRDVVGSYELSMWLLVGFSVLMLLACTRLTSVRLRAGVSVSS